MTKIRQLQRLTTGVPGPNASRLCQNILVFRFTELCGTLTRVLAIFKTRDSDFDRTLREVTISEAGLEIGQPVESADKVLGGQPRRAERITE